MGSDIHEFPLKCWVLIGAELELQDLLNLSLVNKEIRSVITSDEIWMPIVKKTWLDEDKFWGLGQVESSFFEYALLRLKKDQEIYRLLVRISKYAKERDVFFGVKEFFQQAVDGDDYFRYVPKLKELSNCFENSTVRYFATKILQALRHSFYYNFIDDYRDHWLDTDDAIQECDERIPEEIFLIQSLLDPAFERLISLRQKVLDEIFERVENHPDFN